MLTVKDLKESDMYVITRYAGVEFRDTAFRAKAVGEARCILPSSLIVVKAALFRAERESK
mgnify:CR=1 FL=1